MSTFTPLQNTERNQIKSLHFKPNNQATLVCWQ